MRCSETVPHVGLNIVLLHATALSVHHPQVVLGYAESLIGRESIPSESLGVVRGDAAAVVINHAEVVLGLREPLLRQRPPLLQRSGKVAGLIGCEPFLKVRLCPRERGGPPCKREDKRGESQEGGHVLEERLLRSRSHA